MRKAIILSLILFGMTNFIFGQNSEVELNFYKKKDASLEIHPLSSDTIVTVKTEKKQPWKFWKWKSDIKILGTTDRIINTDAAIYSYKFYRLGEKRPFFSYTKDVDKYDTDSYQFFPYNYRFQSVDNAFVISNNLYAINKGRVKKLRSDVLDFSNWNQQEERKAVIYVGSKKRAHLIDFHNNRLNKDEYKTKNFVDVKVLNENGEQGEQSVRMRYKETAYENQKGEVFFLSNSSTPFPKTIKKIPLDKETASVLSKITNIAALPDKPYFVLYHYGRYAYYVVDEEGNWLDSIGILKGYNIYSPRDGSDYGLWIRARK